MSKFGLAAAGIYVAVAVVCAVGSAALGDAKGSFVVRQLPIALQGALAESIGLGSWLQGLSWLTAYLILGGATAAALYLIGALVEKAIR